MNKIRRAGKLIQQNMDSREIILAKYGEQGNYSSKLRRTGELF